MVMVRLIMVFKSITVVELHNIMKKEKEDHRDSDLKKQAVLVGVRITLFRDYIDISNTSRHTDSLSN